MNISCSIKKATAIFMIAFLAFSLSACGSTGADSTSGNSVHEIISTTIPEQSSPKSENSIADTDVTDKGTPNTEPSVSGDVNLDENDMINVNIIFGNQVFDAKFYYNESAQAIVSEMPFTLEMDDYASQEKVTDLTFSLPSASTETPAIINAGDIYLWSGNSLVLFYTTFSNSYSYVPVGYIVDVAGLTDVLGKGSVTVAFQTAEQSKGR